MKTLFWGIALIILVGIGGLIYRNATEQGHMPQVAGCTLDAKVCPDGTAVGREAPSCNFAACPAPNVTLSSAGIIFALPTGFSPIAAPGDASIIAAYGSATTSTSLPAELIIHSYAVGTSSAESVIYATAIGDASGAPVSPSAFSAVTIGNHTYSYVVLGRFEGVVHTAYYLPEGANLLRFDAITPNVNDWTDPNLQVASLPANVALRAMLQTIQTNQ